jgi:uncharacterized protein YbjQ (UPF0145 family)
VSWDGLGLPPGALRRLEAQKSFKVKSSFLSAKQSYGTRLAGFEPLSEVMGACVISLTSYNMAFCGFGNFGFGSSYSYGLSNYGVITNLSTPGNFAGTRVEAFEYGINQAISRMLAEADTIGAGGVTDIRIETNRLSAMELDFVAYANALNIPREIDKFSTHLNGHDVYKLFQAGYRPVEFIADVSAAIVHDDFFTRSSMSMLNPNQEVTRFSELVHVARSTARSKLAAQAASKKAKGVIIQSQKLEFHSQEAGENHVDHIASVTTLGSSITVSDFKAKEASLTMLKLG